MSSRRMTPANHVSIAHSVDTASPMQVLMDSFTPIMRSIPTGSGGNTPDSCRESLGLGRRLRSGLGSAEGFGPSVEKSCGS
ncbi:MAG: hypothetical protein IIC52_04820 [Proteobacteria bacterium]|nr:hypothetical protein [Pseudomonadota bacterium]